MFPHAVNPILNVSSFADSVAWFKKLGWDLAHCLKQGLDVTWPPTNQPWNVREMHLRHPDGHVFRVSKSLEEQE